MAKSSGLTLEVVSYLSYRGEPHRQDIDELQTLKLPMQRDESFSLTSAHSQSDPQLVNP